MIEVKDLSKRYGDHYAIRGLNFSVSQGEVLGFLGPNGAGKSTTMKIISGFVAASEGSVSIGGCDIREQALAAKAQLGYLPETPPVYLQMTVRDFVEFAAGLRHVPAAVRTDATNRALARCGLTQVKDRVIGNLSKGYRQRVGLAQAIVHSPPVLILDEPTVGLDPKQIIDIRELILELGQDHTILLSTHILPEVQALCSRVVVIDSGVIRAQDTIAGLSARLRNRKSTYLEFIEPNADLERRERLKQILLEIPAVEEVREMSADDQDSKRKRRETASSSISWMVESDKEAEVRGAIARACVNEGFELLEMKEQELSLEDAFIRLVGGEQ